MNNVKMLIQILHIEICTKRISENLKQGLGYQVCRLLFVYPEVYIIINFQSEIVC